MCPMRRMLAVQALKQSGRRTAYFRKLVLTCTVLDYKVLRSYPCTEQNQSLKCPPCIDYSTEPGRPS